MIRELMNQLWPTERLQSSRARAGRIAALGGEDCSIQAVLARMLRL